MNYGWLVELRVRWDLWLAEMYAGLASKHRRRAAKHMPLILMPDDLVTRMRKGEGQ